MTTGAPGPDWHLRSVVYQIFPDRFATTGAAPGPPPWGKPKQWSELPTGRGFGNQYDFYGGDLARRGAAPRPRRAPRRRRDLPDADLPGRHLAPVRLGDVRPDRPAARRRRCAALARPGRPRARAAADRRPDAQPFRQRPRVVHARTRGHRRAGALLLLLGRVAAARLRELVRAAAPAEAQLGLGRAHGPRARRRRPLARGGPRRLADRRRQHDRPLPRRRPHARGRARGARRGRRGRPGRGHRRRARARLPGRPARRRLARRHELRRLLAPRLVVAPRRRAAGGAARRVLGLSRRPRPLRRRAGRRDHARVPRRRAVGRPPALVGAARLARHRALLERDGRRATASSSASGCR